MRALQFLHLADVHLGKRQYGSYEREQDFYRAFEQAVEIALRERVDAFVISGDLFDSPVPYHGMEPLEVALKAVRRLKEAGVEVLLIPGDHDAPKKLGRPSILFLEEFGEAKVLRGERGLRGVEVKGVKFYGVQAYSLQRPTEKKRLEEALLRLRAVRDKEKSVLMLHLGLCDFLPFGCLDMNKLPQGFGYYAMGHVHKYDFKYFGGNSPVVYPGSLEVVSREEIVDINNKGPVLVDASNSFKFEKIKIDVRPQLKIVVRGPSISARSEFERQAAKVPSGAIVHLEVSDEAKAYLDYMIRYLKELKRALLVRTYVISSKKLKAETKKTSSRGIGVAEALEELYGRELGEELYKLVEAATEGEEEAYKVLKEIFESGVWRKARHAFWRRDRLKCNRRTRGPMDCTCCPWLPPARPFLALLSLS